MRNDKIDAIINTALSFEGVCESELDKNDVIFNYDYHGKEVSGPDYPWCVTFVWDVFRMCNLSNLFMSGEKADSCDEVYNWGKDTLRLVDNRCGRAGDLILFDWYETGKPEHIGIVLSRIDEDHYLTIEGNTSPLEPANGCGRVMKRTRGIDGVFAIVRPDYYWHVWDPILNEREAWPSEEFPQAHYHYFKESGCLVTSLAIVLRYCGIEKETDESKFNPWILYERFKSIGAFSPSADLDVDSVSKLYPIEYLGDEEYQIDKLRKFLDDGDICLLEVPGSSEDRLHYIVAVSVTEDDVEVVDDGFDKTYLSEFSTTYSIVRFRRTDSGPKIDE